MILSLTLPELVDNYIHNVGMRIRKNDSDEVQ